MTNRVTHPQVTLVGAGPGDPDLLTLKALKALQSASVILVDDLVSDAIVALAQPAARVIWVGKRGGCRSTPQAFIHKLMIQAALDGERVVRLKGGDPLILGRGGEEIDHLRAAGIEVEIINGVTSALAGMASIQTALTHRDHAQGVIFITGHRQKEGLGTPWAEPQQRQALTTLGDLAQCVSLQGFASPTVMVVGQVVAGMQALGIVADMPKSSAINQP